MPFLHVTTRIEGRKHDGLLSEIGGRAFPHMVWLDASGEVIAQQGSQSVKGFEKTLGMLTRRADLTAKAAAGDAGAKVDLALLEGQLGNLDFEEVEEQLDGVELSPDQKKTLGMLQADATVNEHILILRRTRGDKDALADARADLLELYKKGVYPDRNSWGFWQILRGHAEETKDVKLMTDCVANLKKILAGVDSPRAKKFVTDLEAKLAEMKAASG